MLITTLITALHIIALVTATLNKVPLCISMLAIAQALLPIGTGIQNNTCYINNHTQPPLYVLFSLYNVKIYM